MGWSEWSAGWGLGGWCTWGAVAVNAVDSMRKESK